MNNNKQTDKKSKRIEKLSYLSLPDEMLDALGNSRYKNKEGLYRVMYFFLYRAAYHYSMRVSQRTIANHLGLDRGHVNELITKLRELGLIVMTYHTVTRNDIVCHQVSSYRISQGLRDASPEFQSKLCYLFPFLAKVAFSFFSIVGALQRRLSKHLRYTNPTLYNSGVNIINYYYKDRDKKIPKREEEGKRSQKGSKNGLENPTRGKDASPIKGCLKNLIIFSPN